MKKLIYLFTVVFCMSILSSNSFADGVVKLTLEKKEETKSAKKPRRKKVEMCHECGKPEPQCECKGEGHRGENNHHDKEENKENKNFEHE